MRANARKGPFFGDTYPHAHRRPAYATSGARNTCSTAACALHFRSNIPKVQTSNELVKAPSSGPAVIRRDNFTNGRISHKQNTVTTRIHMLYSSPIRYINDTRHDRTQEQHREQSKTCFSENHSYLEVGVPPDRIDILEPAQLEHLTLVLRGEELRVDAPGPAYTQYREILGERGPQRTVQSR